MWFCPLTHEGFKQLVIRSVECTRRESESRTLQPVVATMTLKDMGFDSLDLASLEIQIENDLADQEVVFRFEDSDWNLVLEDSPRSIAERLSRSILL